MDGIIAYALSRAFTKKTVVGMGALKGAPCKITSIVDNLDGTHDITFSWKDDSDVTHTSVLTVEDGETPSFSSVVITGGHRLTFTTQDPTQSVSFDVMDGAKGDTGVSVVASNVDENNNLTLTLSNGNVINAGKIKAVTVVDNTLSTTSTNPVENKVITSALNDKVDKEIGKGLFSNEEKTKLENIEDGAQVNVLEKLIINGQEAAIVDKSIALTLITSAVSNLQNYYLKTETYTKQEVEDLIGSTVGVTIEIVEQLPTEGQSNVIYFLPTETEGVYSQYIYTTDGWILIGSTTVDLSNYYTKAQVDTLLNGKQNVLTIDSFPTALSNNPVASGGVYTAIAQMQPQFQFSNMPTASAGNLGFVYQYIGATGTYTQNMFYRCVYDSTLGEYKWEEVIFHAVVTVDSELSPTSTNPVQNKVVKEALDTKQDIIQYSTMPSAQDNLGKVVQYIGTNTANYTNGYFYKAIYDSESDVYLWTVIKFSADMLVDSALSTTSENPVQNKVITGAINDIQDVIPSEASSTNQLVDRDSLGTASQKDFTPYVSPNNTDIPISSSVYSAITSAVYGAYHPSGSKTIAELTSDLLVFANIGNVYKITEDGLTTDLFIGGAGQTIHTGDNAVVVYGGQPNTFLFSLQSGSIDLTPYQTKELGSVVEGATTVEGALGALSINKATQTEVNDIVNVLSAKNLLPNTAVTQTINGITFTVNSDGSVIVNGTATETTELPIYTNTDGSPYLVGKTIKLSGCPSNGGSSTYRLQAYRIGSVDGSTGTVSDIGDGIEATWLNNGSETKAVVKIIVNSGVTVSNLVFKPMIRLASIVDDTYEPYAKTNQQLTHDKAEQAEVNDINNVLGAKNLLPYPYDTSTITKNNVSFTDNGDGTITISTLGDRSSNTFFNLSIKLNFGASNWSLNGSSEKEKTIGSFIASNGFDNFVSGLDFGYTASNMQTWLVVRPSAELNNVTIKPMIRLASDPDNTYVLYAPTNAKLNEEKVSYDDATESVQKNLLKYPYYETTVERNGITWTDLGDGRIMANGTATDNSSFTFSLKETNLSAGAYLFTTNTATSGIADSILNDDTGNRIARGNSDLTTTTLSNTNKFVLTRDMSVNGFLRVFSGKTVSNLIFEPMIRKATINDDTWVSYIPNNTELVSWKANGVLGAKNFVPYPYPISSATINGITFTTYNDGRVVANGTATELAIFDVINSELYEPFSLDKGSYILTDGLSSSDYENAYTAITLTFSDSTIEYNRADTSIGKNKFSMPSKSNIKYFYLGCCVKSGATVSNLTFRPMIRFASDSDDTYQPYAMTNKELTDGLVGTFGHFTPSLKNCTATYTTQNGIYYKIGRLVYIAVTLRGSISAADGYSIIDISGLPTSIKTTVDGINSLIMGNARMYSCLKNDFGAVYVSVSNGEIILRDKTTNTTTGAYQATSNNEWKTGDIYLDIEATWVTP